jgi:hypothetical protein
MTTIQTCVRVPAPTQLCATGCAGGFSVTAFRSRFTVLRISRDRGDRASPLHLGERHYPSTEPKIIYHPQSGWFEDTPLKGGAEEGYPLKGVHEGICLLEARQRAWNRSRASRISP